MNWFFSVYGGYSTNIWETSEKKNRQKLVRSSCFIEVYCEVIMLDGVGPVALYILGLYHTAESDLVSLVFEILFDASIWSVADIR